MASDSIPPSPELLAVSFVVESSLAVLAEWPRIIIDYVAQMLKRLNEANPGYKLHMGFVTYGTTDTYPSPVLCKKYFAEHHLVTKDIKDTPENLGIGTTVPNGNRGMAALEGIVAAMELFDILRSCTQPARPHVNHIFHIAASGPDTSLHPQWNDSPLLDSVTWDDLPSELKKRNIHMSSILLRQNIPRFPELHSTIAPSAPKTPWFTQRSPHSVLLSGFPMSPQKVTKRPGEAHPNERTPDSKRPRLVSQSSVDVSPKVQAHTPNTPSMQPKPSPVAPTSYPQPQAQSQPQPQPQIQTQPQPQVPQQTQAPPSTQMHQPPPPPQGSAQPQSIVNAAQYKSLVLSFRTIEEQVKNLQLSIQDAVAAGNSALAENLRQEWLSKGALHAKFKNAITMYNQKLHAAQLQLQQAQAQASSSNATSSSNPMPNLPPQNPAVNHNPNPSELLPNPNPPLPNLQSTSPNMNVSPQFSADGARNDQQAFAQLMRERALSNSARMPGPNISAQINEQMQKLMEDKQRRAGPGQGHPNMNPGAGAGSMGIVNSGMSQAMEMRRQGMQQPQQPQPQLTGGPSNEHPGGIGPAAKTQGAVIWQGSLSWSGQGPVGKKEMVTWVVASTTNPKDSYVKTWPKNMTLVPVRDPAVSMPELQAWMKQHKPTLCTFAAQSHSIQDRQVNEQNYKMLVQLLSVKHVYAAAAWTRPSGEQGNNVLFFPINNLGLVGAFFPITGTPEVPKPQQAPTPMITLPPELVERMRSMTQEQREAVFNQIKRSQMQAQQARMLNNNNVNAMNLAHAQQNQHQQQPDLGNNGGDGGGGTNPFGGNVPGPVLGNYGGMNMMNTMGMAQGQAPSAAMMGGGLPRSVSGGMMRNADVSYEMMQSFMQRNQGGNGMGGGMGNGMGGGMGGPV